MKANILEEKGILESESEMLIARKACDLATLLVDDGVSIYIPISCKTTTKAELKEFSVKSISIFNYLR